MSDAYNFDNGLTDEFTLPEISVTPEQEENDKAARKKLIDILAKKTLEEEATTGTPSGTREVLAELDRADSEQGQLTNAPLAITVYKNPPPVTTPIPTDDSIPQAGPAPGIVSEGAAPKETLQQIWKRTIGAGAEEPAPDKTPIEELVALGKQAAQPVQKFAAGAVGAVTGGANEILAALLTPIAYGAEKAGFDGPTNLVRGLQQTGAQNRAFASEAFGAKPKGTGNPVEELAGLLGESVTPMKGAGVVKPTMIVAAPQYVVPALLSPAEAAAKKKNDDDQRMLDAERVVETIGGPAKIQNSELATLGGMAAVSLGAIFAPSLFSKMKFGKMPTLRPVNNAAPGTMAMSTATDLARTYDDANAGVLRLARRAGIDPVVMDKIEKTFTTQTRSAARAVADSAIQLGKAETPLFQFKTKLPVSEISKLEAGNPHVSEYLHLRDTIDDLLLADTRVSQQSAAKQAAQAGPPIVRGYDLDTAMQARDTMERAHPELRAISNAYRDNVASMRKFETTGEYATLSKEDLLRLHQTRPNLVPFNGERVMGENVDRGMASHSLADMMQENMRHRMENEAVGMYIDNMRKVQPDLFKRVTTEELKDNPHWKQNVVSMYRRGKLEQYTTDPFLSDVLKLDPYFMTSNAQNLLYSSKRMLETGSTGMLAPWFAVTSALRSWQISKYTAGPYRSATALGTALAVPQQLLPQVARAISNSLDHGSGQWLSHVLSPATVDAMSLRMAKAFDDSLFAQMRSVGTHEGSVLQQQTAAKNALTTAISQMEGPTKSLYEGYQALLQAVHNAPAFNFAKRNLDDVPKADLAALARNLTGDPRVGGQYYGGKGQPIRLEGANRVSHTVAQSYGKATELGRTAIPWFNVTTQGMKRIGEAYLENPAKFVGKAWLYAAMPAAATFFGARAAGKDPNGIEYVDYMMNRRSAYAKLMNYYIPIPGRPAEQGIEFPRFHEMAPVSHMMEVALDHLTRSSIFREGEDFHKAATAFMGAAIMPPMPPIINAALATQGIVGPQGVFGGEAYKKRNDPYDQTGGLPSSLELLARAIGGGAADVFGQGAASFTQTEGNILQKSGNFLKGAGKAIIQKTPIVRDVTGIRSPISGNTDVTEELFAKQREVDQLLKFIQKAGDKEVNTKPASKAGGMIAEKLLGPVLPTEQAGLAQPEPTNPLYNLFMQEVQNKFKKDAPRDAKGDEIGGIGFRSLWRRYGDATAHINRLRPINDGNFVSWQRQLEQRPEQLEYLKSKNVDTTKPSEVRNHYEKVRQDAARTILFTIRAVENQFSERVGKPVKLADLDPYGKGLVPGTGQDESGMQHYLTQE